MTVLCLVCMLLLLYVILLRPGRGSPDHRLLTDYAHRGLHSDTVPENTLAAFSAAAENGFGIELDLRLSSDGEVMVFHDDTLLRFFGSERRFSELSSFELDQLCLSQGRERIPRFSDVLQSVNGKVPLLIELKGKNLDTAICRKTYELLRRYDGLYCVESFNPMYVRWFAKHCPDIYRGLLYDNAKIQNDFSILHLFLNTMILNVFARPQFIAYRHDCKMSFSLWLCMHVWKVDKAVWTVKTKEAYEKFKNTCCLRIFESFVP